MASGLFIAKLLALVHLSGDFRSEVFLLLLDAFALLKANCINEADLAAERLCGGLDVLLDGQRAVLDEALLQQAVLFIELADLAGSDLVLDFRGLVRHLRIVVHLRDEDLLFLIQHGIGHLALVPETGVPILPPACT